MRQLSPQAPPPPPPCEWWQRGELTMTSTRMLSPLYSLAKVIRVSPLASVRVKGEGGPPASSCGWGGWGSLSAPALPVCGAARPEGVPGCRCCSSKVYRSGSGGKRGLKVCRWRAARQRAPRLRLEKIGGKSFVTHLWLGVVLILVLHFPQKGVCQRRCPDNSAGPK
jgi:hypothetical protein